MKKKKLCCLPLDCGTELVWCKHRSSLATRWCAQLPVTHSLGFLSQSVNTVFTIPVECEIRTLCHVVLNCATEVWSTVQAAEMVPTTLAEREDSFCHHHCDRKVALDFGTVFTSTAV